MDAPRIQARGKGRKGNTLQGRSQEVSEGRRPQGSEGDLRCDWKTSMSIVPEYILQHVLVKGLRAIRDDGRIVDMLFRNLRQSDLERLRTFFQESTIDISLNYPDQDLHLPAVVILLKSEAESQAFLGNVMEGPQMVRALGHPFPKDELRGDATVLGAGSVATTGGGYRIYLRPTKATKGDDAAVYIAEGLVNVVDPFEEDVFVVILEGTGAGQTRQILMIDPIGQGFDSKITVTPAWTTNPDSTSVIEVRTAADQPGVTGEPSKLFSSQDIIERKGVIYQATYDLLIVGPNPETTVFLYSLVKALIFLNEDFLVKQGFMNIAMSGTDFTPRTEFYPDLAYQRALTLSFSYSFDVYQKASEATLIDKITIALAVHDPDVKEVEDPGRTVIETTLDLTP